MKQERSWIEIDLAKFRSNLRELTKLIPQNIDFLQIVKADAYGHGALQIAEEAINLGAKLLGVANSDEGILLRSKNVTIPILILSPSLEHEIPQIVNNNLTPSISSDNFLNKFSDYLKEQNIESYPVHINIDTGMKRSGVAIDDFPKFYSKITNLTNIVIEGIYSHFAGSESDTKLTLSQRYKFKLLLESLESLPRYIHLDNSYGLLSDDFSFSNLVRIGILSFGIKTNEIPVKLKPIMKFYSKISHIGNLAKGEGIGYNHTFIAEENLKYGIIPIGYADGYDYLLSNKGKVYIRDYVCNIIGRVSMDMIAIEIPDSTKINDVVELIGEKEEIRAENVVKNFQGSAYELICQLGRRAKRFYYYSDVHSQTSPVARREFLPTDFTNKELNNAIEKAINARLNGQEIAQIVYNDVLERFFTDFDHNKSYRENFKHSIEIISETTEFYKIRTTLTFEKILCYEHFYVACANNPTDLEQYFSQKNVEYRWLLDSNMSVDVSNFKTTDIMINDIKMHLEYENKFSCLLIKCSHQDLSKLINRKVKFTINTSTYYSKTHSQLTVYIAELTKGVEVNLFSNGFLKAVNPVTIFSGKSRFPYIKHSDECITIKTNKDQWVFPNSGIVFSYR